MLIDWAAVLGKLNKIPGFSATAAHVSLFKDLYLKAQEECDRLSQRCKDLENENDTLKKELASLTFGAELIEIDGILWKRKSSGGFDSKPRCPNCHNHPVMGEFPPNAKMHWVCSVCDGTFDYVVPPTEQTAQQNAGEDLGEDLGDVVDKLYKPSVVFIQQKINTICEQYPLFPIIKCLTFVVLKLQYHYE